jgi:DNA modification methylase
MEIKDIVNTVICGDCLEVMKKLPDELVNCVVTSPPYWGLRDYGVAGQFGLEKTPEEFIEKMVVLFREVRRVLRKDGVLWLNLGDSYAANRGYQVPDSKHIDVGNSKGMKASDFNLKPKDLCMIPARVALALQADGWYLRSQIPWVKRNPMPESTTDRPTTAIEYVFLMTKSAKYWYDAEAVKVDSVDEESYTGRRFRGRVAIYESGSIPGAAGNSIHSGNNEILGKQYPKRNRRNSDWFFDSWQGLYSEDDEPLALVVNPMGSKEAHFATFPEKLVEPCILAGCPKEVCPKCGKARVRIVERKAGRHTPEEAKRRIHATGGAISGGTECCTLGATDEVETKTIGFTDCNCGVGFVPGVVLDPFGGAMTTALVAYKNSRDYVAIELNQKYIEMGTRRLNREKEKLSLFGKSPCIVPEPMIKQEENLF